MITIDSLLKAVLVSMILVSSAVCFGNPTANETPHPDGQAALDYLKNLKGHWEVQGGKEGPFGWDFDVTSRDGVVVERLKVGTPTEMTTIYHLDGGILHASHFCQLDNQPHLKAMELETEGDLHFICDGNVGGTESHAELHMHGVHFKKNGDSLSIWMDMVENGEVAFQTSYELTRTTAEE